MQTNNNPIALLEARQFANLLSPDDAFLEIGKLMTAWVAQLSIRYKLFNDSVLIELAAYRKTSYYNDDFRSQQERVGALNAFLRPVLSVAYLKRTIPGVALVLSGSPKMDTGAAFMLFASHADLSLPEDNQVSDSLILLTVAARPAWDPKISKSTPGRRNRKP